MGARKTDAKAFLFLQGPHGPFFAELARSIAESGASVTRIGFNEGDRFFWRDRKNFVAFTDPLDKWAEYIRTHMDGRITDLVIYGDTRPIHKTAIVVAKELGIRVHCFEEGYLRPYWVTYERGGVNGHSRLMDLSVDDMREALKSLDTDQPEAPARWGDMRQHILLGAIYHWQVLTRNRRFKHYKSHRDIPVRQEFRLHFKRLLTRPIHAFKRWKATRKIKRNGFVYHLSLLQLSHDASIRSHSEFANMREFMRVCVRDFTTSAPLHHHLVFKSHPLEDDREPLSMVATDLAAEYDVSNRVHFVRGGKLAELLDFARSVVTINSTAAQQALWRGLPVKAMGESVFSKPEFTSAQNLEDFFANPKKPDLTAYRDYRQYLLFTSQITGGFYSRKGRVRLVRKVVDMVLSDDDPYELLRKTSAAPMQQLRAVT
ncbi:MAG: capsule biosynthesis protein CapA [Rhodobacteraceae bacterium]|nr:capsule biosynthesis protein CapA [Paracoccaceae bacterium]